MSTIKTIKVGFLKDAKLTTSVQTQPVSTKTKNEFTQAPLDKNTNVFPVNVPVNGHIVPKTIKEIAQGVVEQKDKIAAAISPQIKLNRFDITQAKNLVTSADFFNTTSKKYNAYELASGISQERPQIISLFEYKPIYIENKQSKTPEGQYFDAEVMNRIV